MWFNLQRLGAMKLLVILQDWKAVLHSALHVKRNLCSLFKNNENYCVFILKMCTLL